MKKKIIELDAIGLLMDMKYKEMCKCDDDIAELEKKQKNKSLIYSDQVKQLELLILRPEIRIKHNELN
jgi:hypothetical protein